MEGGGSEHGRSHGSGRVQPGAAARLRSCWHVPGAAHGSARRHEAGQGGEESGVRAEECIWRRLDFDPLGAWGVWGGEQSHQEFLRRVVISVVANRDFGVRAGILELRTFSWAVAGARMDARAVWHRAHIYAADLHWDVMAIGGAGSLFAATSGEHDIVHLHAAALDDSHIVERWHRVAGDEVSAGGTAPGDGVTQYQHGPLGLAAVPDSCVGWLCVFGKLKGVNPARLFAQA